MEESRSIKRAKMNTIVEEELDSAKQTIRTKIEALTGVDFSNVQQFRDFSLQVEQELSLAKQRIETRVMEIDKDGDNDSPDFRRLKLQFKGKISKKILTGEEIKGEGDEFLEVRLVDTSTENLEKAGKESSLKVEIVLLKGDPDASEGDEWTRRHFEANIVKDIVGKKPLLKGKTQVTLQNGIARLKGLTLRHRAEEPNEPNSKPVFHLAVRVVNTAYRNKIEEAITEAFLVQNYRKKYSKKHKKPSVKDEIFRLVNIRKGGEYYDRLKGAGIHTVGEFLIRHLRDPEELKDIVKMVQGKWSNTVANAQACVDKRKYFYADVQHNTGIEFNDLGDVLRLYSNNQCTSRNSFSEDQKREARKFLGTACENWGAVKALNDENANAHQEWMEWQKLYCPPPSNLNAAGGGSEMGGECSRGASFGFDNRSRRKRWKKMVRLSLRVMKVCLRLRRNRKRKAPWYYSEDIAHHIEHFWDNDEIVNNLAGFDSDELHT